MYRIDQHCVLCPDTFDTYFASGKWFVTVCPNCYSKVRKEYMDMRKEMNIAFGSCNLEVVDENGKPLKVSYILSHRIKKLSPFKIPHLSGI